MNRASKQLIIENYRGLFRKHGQSPAAVQGSSEGKRLRFEKLAEVATLTNRKVLDLGCGLGHLYPFLVERFGAVEYTGVDLVPEFIAHARVAYPGARFLCRDVVDEPLTEAFDYVLMSEVFNNAMPGATECLKETVATVWAYAMHGLAFNFISTHVNFVSPNLAYHDPVKVLAFCVDHVSRKVTMHHHYERCDVAVFLYR